MAFQFQKRATKHEAKLRLALHGPSGSGKTYTALAIATALVGENGRVALLDTESRSSEKYADNFEFYPEPADPPYHIDRVSEAISGAAAAGCDAIIIDSITHFWKGPGGFLTMVDEIATSNAAKFRSKVDSYSAWKDADPIYQRVIHSILSAPIHVIVTSRAKTQYERVEDEKGRTKLQKGGLAPEVRDGFEYEFDIEGMLDIEHNLVIGKTRCQALDGRVFHKAGRDVAGIIREWLTGAPAEKPAPPTDQHTRALTLEERVEAARSAIFDLDPDAAPEVDRIVEDHAQDTPLAVLAEEDGAALIADLKRLYLRTKHGNTQETEAA